MDLAADLALLGDDEPQPFELINPEGSSPLFLVCDHASNFVPRALNGLGLDPARLSLHIAYDIGAAAVTRRLAAGLDAPAVLSHFSRLVIDPNRPLDDEASVPPVSDGIAVPGNQALPGGEREARIATFFQPYHQAVGAALHRRLHRGQLPIFVSVHSFTPMLEGERRPWEIGVLWDHGNRVAPPLIEALRRRGLNVGDNEPYSGTIAFGFTTHHHAAPRGLPQVLLELRQDLVDTDAGAAAWAEILMEELRALSQLPAARELDRG